MNFRMVIIDVKEVCYAAIKENNEWTFYEIESGRDDRDPLTEDELIDIIKAALKQNLKIIIESLKNDSPST